MLIAESLQDRIAANYVRPAARGAWFCNGDTWALAHKRTPHRTCGEWRSITTGEVLHYRFAEAIEAAQARRDFLEKYHNTMPGDKP